jgi:hypothetical protein
MASAWWMDARCLLLRNRGHAGNGSASDKAGVGSAYAYTARDSRGEYLDGAKNYKITLTGPIPAARFWSFTVHDNQTRSLLETDQISAGLDSTFPNLPVPSDPFHARARVAGARSSSG